MCYLIMGVFACIVIMGITLVIIIVRLEAEHRSHPEYWMD